MSKVPAWGDRPIGDAYLVAALEAELAPLEGEKLRRAQAAILRERESGFVAPVGELVERFRAAIREAVEGA